ncbi:hypothetical protein emb_1c0144 [Coriobacteriaceae bacterium EMTCatB1]|nr:hypothetical protein emb_1c0144 [Coriobacteriaceae bacterium EMTCatB1]
MGKVDPSGEWAVRTIWSAWVPLWKVGSWLYRQAVYAAVSAWASSAAASAVWARASSRVIGNATAKMAARIAKWAVKGLSKLFAVDPMLARVTDLVAKLQWSVRLPTLAVWVYHHAGYAATFCRATLIETRRLFTERFGYVTRASVTRRLFTDAQAREVAKDCLYLSS